MERRLFVAGVADGGEDEERNHEEHKGKQDEETGSLWAAAGPEATLAELLAGNLCVLLDVVRLERWLLEVGAHGAIVR